MTYLWIIIAIVVVAAIGLTLYLVPRRGRGALPPATRPSGELRPGAADEAEQGRDASGSSVGTLAPPPPDAVTTPPVEGPSVLPPAEAVPELEVPEPTAGRLQRLRARLARSQNVFGRGLLSVLSREHLDEEAWEEVEDALLSADVGVGATAEIVGRLRDRTKVIGTRSTGELRALLADELVAVLQPDMDRTLRTLPHDGHPAVLLVVGVNGTGKTTTCGKLARVLVADGRTVLLDWEQPGRGAPLSDLAWYLAINCRRLPQSKEASIAAYREELERCGIDTGPWWERQLALCLLGAMVLFGWEKALGGYDEELAWWETRSVQAAALLS